MLRSLLMLSVVLAIPIIPLLVWGELFAGAIARWSQTPPNPTLLAVTVAAILAGDIFLPVPSGPVATLAGAKLGLLWGAAACWFGMTVGAVVAYALARRYGRRLALRFSSSADLQRMEQTCRTLDAWMLLATRPIPVLAEACVLLVGVLGTPWRRFLPAVTTGNAAIAITYAALGHYSARHNWLPLAVCLSLAVPVLLAVLMRGGGESLND